MSKNKEALAKLMKACELSNRAFRKNGPKSFKNGVGALLVALEQAGGTMTQRDLIDVLGMGRKGVKEIVKKAVRSELVVMGDSEEKKTYTVSLTEEGASVAAKRIAADGAVIEKIFAGVTEEELEALLAACDKLVVNAKEMGASGKRKFAFKHSHRFKKGCKGQGRKCHRHGKRCHD